MPDRDPVLTTFPTPMGNGLLVKVFDPQTGKFGTGFFGQFTPPRGQDGEVERPLPARGMVVAAGPGTYHVQSESHLPMAVQVGDEVLFFDQFSQPIEIGEGDDVERLVLLAEDHVMVVLSRSSVSSSSEVAD